MVAFGYPFAETPDAWVPIGLSAAADFQVSQVVDRTTGVHGVIPKVQFDNQAAAWVRVGTQCGLPRSTDRVL